MNIKKEQNEAMTGSDGVMWGVEIAEDGIIKAPKKHYSIEEKAFKTYLACREKELHMDVMRDA